jgi:radical SAM PhpK family P-methyltransferase
MQHHTDLDCVIVGYNDLDFSQVEQRHRETAEHSGAYNHVVTNSVRYRGQRVAYMELLNRVMAEATGQRPQLHVCELPNLGVYQLASFLRQRDYSVGIVNFFNEQKQRFVELLAQSPRAVAITTTFYTDNEPIADIIKFIRRHNAETKIVVGGPHVSNLCSVYDPLTLNFVLKEIGADFYVNDSQGELTLSRIVEGLRGGQATDFAGIPNLIYSPDGKDFVSTARAAENNDMDENSVKWDYFEKSEYVPTAQMRTARSCAFNCAFCRYPIVAGPLNLTSLDVLERDMSVLRAAGVKNLVFIDDTFNVPLPRFKDLCRMMIRNRFDFDWFSYFRCSNSDEEAFDLMQESGCKGVFLGVESGDQQILNNMNKFAKVERYESGIRALTERGIVSFVSIIVGFPGETVESVQRTRDFIERTAPTFYRMELYWHDEKVPIHARAAEFGIRGRGYSWQHNTMDWRRASELIIEMYRSIKNSVVLPIYMFDFWSIPYLVGRGIPIPRIVDFAKGAQELLLPGLDDREVDTSEQERRLVSLFTPAGESERAA